MRIICPQCGFFRELPDHKVPVTSTMATCPKCRHRFKFRPGSEDTPHPDLVRSAPRAEAEPRQAGEEAPSSWRRPGPAAARRHEEPPAAAHWDPREVSQDLSQDVSEDVSEDGPGEAFSDPPPQTPEAPRPQTATPPRRTLREGEAPPWSPAPSSRPAFEAEDIAPETDREAAEPLVVAPRQARPQAPAAGPGPMDQPSLAANEAPEVPPARSVPGAADGPGPSRNAPAGHGSEDKDGVRDIWARLQAMEDEPAPRRTVAEKPGRPEEEPDRGEPATDPIPWERQDIYGFFPGLFLTLKKILFRPMEFFASLPMGRPKGKALVFNLLISEFLLVIDFMWSLFGLRARFGASGQSDFTGAFSASPGLGLLLALLLVPLILAVGVYLDAWLTHLLLLLFRSAKKGFSETFRVMCYSAAPTVLSAVPVAGQILSPVILIWYMTLQAIGLKKVHEGAYTQTLAAVFIKWSLYLFLLLAMLQSFAPGH